ncbi:MAG TPA: RNA helicase [Chloroflexi bacterium]|nr:RNA helicase [Chloroflexota bacterium]|tara:strand:+ start:11588 stop:12967 length:1380 start_codon:yes stop_codon:yes gene_type:complete
MSVTFAQLGVSARICRALERDGISIPFEIQAATIADGLDGRDVCGRAPTGSGKTIAFGVPLVSNLEQANPKQPHALVLAPTRELAEQIMVVLRSFAGDIRVGAVYGGVGYGQQYKMLQRGIEVLVACPGRLEDLIEQGRVDLSAVTRVVLDEADRMVDMGFMPAVKRLLNQTSKDRQTFLFSATLDQEVAKFTKAYQRDPVHHSIGNESPDITSARHFFWSVPRTERLRVTADVLKTVSPALVFCRTRHGANRLAKQLSRFDITVATIHGNRTQNQRARALDEFASGQVQALVATDVAARGIHVDAVAVVLHYDPPADAKTYVHRSGRTARAGREGLVVSLVHPDEIREARKLDRDVGIKASFSRPNIGSLNGASPEREAAMAGNFEGNADGSFDRLNGSPSPERRTRRNRRRFSRPSERRPTSKQPKMAAAPTASSQDQVSRPNRKARRAHLQWRSST